MSGLFKNFERLIPAVNFTSNTHKFLVRFCGASYNPAGFYYDPNTRLTGLPRSHGLDLFGLSMTSYELIRLNRSYQQVLEDINSCPQVPSQEVKAEVEQEINLTKKAIDNYLSEAVIQLRTGGFSLPAKSCADLLFTLAFSADKKKAAELFTKYVLPTLREKLPYASTQNLIDIVVGLNELQYFQDADLWRDIFQTIEGKTFAWEYSSVEYHAWQLDVYETSEKSAPGGSASDLELFWNDVKGGSLVVANLKRQFRFYWNFAINRIMLPFFQRENRVLYNFPSRNRISEKEAFFAVLNSIQDKFPDAKNVIQKLKARPSTY